MMTVTHDLLEIIRKVLSSLGEPAMEAFFWELNSQNISVNPEEFDLRKFEQALKKVFGDGSKIFLDEIYAQLSYKYCSQNQRDEIDKKTDPTERILMILSSRVST